MLQAENACDAWKAELDTVEFSRSCRHEEETNQYLGIEREKDNTGIIWSSKVVKHFRY